ncbi:MAG: 3-dehydroquinate dehydratase [Oscillospiraceae bacterium]|nr:3-dehydroquinate dehydratase [Oscillospiraceae bacterium]
MVASILNGPNINLIGQREPEIYGKIGYEKFVEAILKYADALKITCELIHSNSEGTLIDKIQSFEGDFIILNSGAYTHYSHAIADAVRAVSTPVIEVHLTNINSRETFRKNSVIAPFCVAQLSGFGWGGYFMALDFISGRLKRCWKNT